MQSGDEKPRGGALEKYSIAIAVAIAALAIGGYFEYKHLRLEEGFRRSEEWALHEMAAKARAIVPRMLDGLHDADPAIRDASRQVLFLDWNDLSDTERAVTARTKSDLVGVEFAKNGELIVQVRCSADGAGESLLFTALELLDNDRVIARRAPGVGVDVIIGPRTKVSGFSMRYKGSSPSILAGDRLQVIGWSQLQATAWDGERVNFSIDWKTKERVVATAQALDDQHAVKLN